MTIASRSARMSVSPSCMKRCEARVTRCSASRQRNIASMTRTTCPSSRSSTPVRSRRRPGASATLGSCRRMATSGSSSCLLGTHGPLSLLPESGYILARGEKRVEMSMDRVVLLADDGTEIGSALKSDVHGAHTPLHLAFSCYVLDDEGRLLVTRRALGKRTWPGVWTNSFCGHPRPGEPVPDAVRRHARVELGAELADLHLQLPVFRYRAVDASGVVEHEVCPVYSARLDSGIRPNPDEVMDHTWVEPDALAAAARLTPWAFSPWLVLQVEMLELFRLEDAA